MTLLRFSIKSKQFFLLYLSAVFFSFLVNFCIDILVYGYVFFTYFSIYFLVNIPVQIIITFVYLLIVDTINKRYWHKKLIHRVFYEISFVFIITTILILILSSLPIKYDSFGGYIANLKSIFFTKYVFTNYVENLMVVLFLEMGYLLLKSKNEEVQFEKLKYENESYKYNQLKNQINPHFLFNSLNILSGMVYTREAKESANYIGKLSEVYRYVLMNDEKAKITLREEIEFINKYGDILKTRFAEGFRLNIDLSGDYMERHILPMSIQLLVENAVKHNITSENNPLVINIYIEDDYIVVENNINARSSRIISTGIGLKNLSQRYKIASRKDISIVKNDMIYKVKVPLI